MIKINIRNQFFLLSSLFICLFFGLFFSSAVNTNAFADLSPDGKTCTPCHEEGEHNSDVNNQPETQQPDVQQPKAQQPEAQQPDKEDKPLNPWIVVSGVIAILAIIYFLTFKKR